MSMTMRGYFQHQGAMARRRQDRRARRAEPARRTMPFWTCIGVAAAAIPLLVEASALASVMQASVRGAPSYSLPSSQSNAFNYEAREQIAAYVDLVHSSYAEAATQASELRKAVELLLSAPSDATLAEARASWVAARPSYLRTEAFRFYNGPIDAIEGDINAWPVNEAFIDSVQGKPKAGIVNDPSVPVDLRTIMSKNQAGDEKDVTTGWHAIEFLLWGQDLSDTGPGNRPATDYTAGQGNNDRRREYLRLITARLANELQGLAQAWNRDAKGSYASEFLQYSRREALGRMINGMAILAGFELMSERLAVALDSGDQEDEHSCFSDTTHQDFVHDLMGIKAVWTGDGADRQRRGLDDLVRGRDAALAERIDGYFADAEAKIAALGDPWDRVLATPSGSPERQAGEAAVVALGMLRDGLTEVGDNLGVLVLIPSG